MSNIREMKIEVLKMLEEKYSNAKGTYSKVSNEEIEEKHFLLAIHAAAVRCVCESHNYSISFRNAGQNTLERIRQGHPCKGHLILDKSIKQKGTEWTYRYDDISRFAGLIGYKDESNDEPNDEPNVEPNDKPNDKLSGLWKLDETTGKAIQQPIENYNEDKTYYTGDYDMHDLLKFNGERYCRIVADTPDEHSAIDYFNLEMTRNEGETDRKKIVHDYSQRTTQSAYSLIRHGAQTSYMCFLHGITGSKELKKHIKEVQNENNDKTPSLLYFNNIIQIDPNICIFDKAGNAYILNSLPAIYQYYKDNNLLDMIPFYYFFAELQKDEKYKEEIEKYSKQINQYLRDCYEDKNN